MKTVEERKKRWTRATDATEHSFALYRIHYDHKDLSRPDLWPDKIPERIEWARQSYEGMLERSEWLDDDTVPHLEIATGTEIFAEAFGSKVHRAPGEMPFALPAASSAAEAAELQDPDINHPALACLFHIADTLRGEYGPEAVIKLPDIQSPMDIAALIADKNQFYIDMVTDPDGVKALSSRVKKLLISFLDAWFDRYGTSYIAHYPAYYMEGGMTLSEDEIGAVNQEMYGQFFRDELTELSEHFGGIGIHCCADARHQWEGLKQVPGLRVLNLVQPVELVDEAYSFFGSMCLHYHQPQVYRSSIQWDDSWPVRQGVRMVIEAQAESRDEALRLADAMAEYSEQVR